MEKKKTKLDLANKKVEVLIELTNNKINELSRNAKTLYDSLNLIQILFDEIRNIPNEKHLEYERIKEVTLSWKRIVNKIEDDYNTAVKVQLSKGSASTAFGIGIAALGPSAAMGIATTFGVASTGTAIASLSGAAATNAALAWLGGGALVAGGGGIAAGNALLALAGPVGWGIAAASLIGSFIFFWKAKSEKTALEKIFLLISEREEKKYSQVIVELEERIKRIKDETIKLNEAITTIKTFGTNYNTMAEGQQYTLGSYVNLMNASAQLLVNPILGLQPRFIEKDLNLYRIRHILTPKEELIFRKKPLFIYIANLLYKIDTEESDRKLLSKSFRNNKDFLENAQVNKNDLRVDLFNLVDNVLKDTYKAKR